MILRLAASLFEAPSIQQSRLLRRLLQSLHGRDGDSLPPVLRIEPEAAETDEHGPFHGWLERQGEFGTDVRELLELGKLSEATLPAAPLGLEVEAWSHRSGAWRRALPLDVTVELRPQSDWPSLRLTLPDALDLVHEPLQLRLEDELNDRAFIGWLASAASRRDFLQLANAPARVQPHGGGTGGLKRWLDGLAQRRELSPDEQRRLWRTWVLFDKDAGALDAREPSSGSKALIELCEEVIRQHRIPFTWVCLQRREIESYVPDGFRGNGVAGSMEAMKILRQWRSRPDRQELAWAYDMKEGLKGDLVPGLSKQRQAEIQASQHDPPAGNELKEPFKDLDKDTRRVLLCGFGDNVLNKPLHDSRAPDWLHQIAHEYDRGPAHQFPRLALLQSIFDRI